MQSSKIKVLILTDIILELQVPQPKNSMEIPLMTHSCVTALADADVAQSFVFTFRISSLLEYPHF